MEIFLFDRCDSGYFFTKEKNMKKIISLLVLIITLAAVWAVCASAVDVYEAFTKETFEYEGTKLPYRLYVPEDFDATKKYPLVLFLHGAGERGEDNEAQLKNAVQILFDREDKLIQDAIVVAPQCPVDNQWVDTPWENGNYSVAEIPESNELATAVELVKSLADIYPCDPARLYVMGISMGGFGTWDVLMRHNDIFAAGIPICGGADPEMAEIFMETPVFTFHGTADTTVPYDGTAEMVGTIEDLGSRVVNFISYNNDGHGIWDKAAREEGLMEWLFSQKLEIAAPDTEPADSAEDTKDTAPAETTPDTPAVTDTQGTEKSDEEKPADDDGGFPVGAIIAVAAAVVVAVAAALTVALKKKK